LGEETKNLTDRIDFLKNAIEIKDQEIENISKLKHDSLYSNF